MLRTSMSLLGPAPTTLATPTVLVVLLLRVAHTAVEPSTVYTVSPLVVSMFVGNVTLLVPVSTL